MTLSGMIDSVHRRNGDSTSSPHADNAKHAPEKDASPAFQITSPPELLALERGGVR